MSLASLLLGIWLILVGVDWLAWVAISTKFLGLLAFITGLLWLISAYHPINISKP